MIIKLVSFPCVERLSIKQRKYRIKTASDILNEKDVDFVMFSEWIFDRKNDLDKVCQLVNNKNVTALFELSLDDGLIGNQLFLLQNGEITDLKTHQIFCESNEATDKNVENLIIELEQHRQFEVNGKQFLIIQCGENNILKTKKDTKNYAEFRLQNRTDLKKRFDKIINSVDVILNPVHTKWGRFYDFTCRLNKFSDKNRYCFYCSQLEGNQLDNALCNPKENTSQRAMKNRKIISPLYSSDGGNHEYLLQAYKIYSRKFLF